MIPMIKEIVRGIRIYPDKSWGVESVIIIAILTLSPFLFTMRSGLQRHVGTLVSGLLCGTFTFVLFLVISDFWPTMVKGGMRPQNKFTSVPLEVPVNGPQYAKTIKRTQPNTIIQINLRFSFRFRSISIRAASPLAAIIASLSFLSFAP